MALNGIESIQEEASTRLALGLSDDTTDSSGNYHLQHNTAHTIILPKLYEVGSVWILFLGRVE